MNEIEKKFRKAIFYKRIGFVCIIIAIIPATMKEIILALIPLGLGIFFLTRYRCPYCKYIIDVRVSPYDLEYCPKCGKKLYFDREKHIR